MDRLSCAIIDDDVEFCDQVVELATDSGFRAKGIHTLGEAAAGWTVTFPTCWWWMLACQTAAVSI